MIGTAGPPGRRPLIATPATTPIGPISAMPMALMPPIPASRRSAQPRVGVPIMINRNPTISSANPLVESNHRSSGNPYSTSDPMPGYKDLMGFEHVRNKFERAEFTEIASELVLAPRVAECPIQLEGTVSSITEVGDPRDDTAAIEVRIVRTHVHESILALDHRHHIDPDKWRPLIMNFLEFYGLGSQVHLSLLADAF